MSPEITQSHLFGDAIKRNRGITPIRKAARVAELDHSIWWNVERGDREPLISTYLKITFSLGFTSDEIINTMGLSLATEDDNDPQNLWEQLSLIARNPVVNVEGTFGNRLRSYRRGLRVSKRALAMRIGTNHSQISRIEREDRIPRVSTVVRIALGLRLSPEQTTALIAPYQPGEVVYASQ